MTLCCVMFGLFSSLFIFVLLILHWPSVVSFSFFLRSSFVYFLVGSGIILCFSLQHVIRTAIKSGWVREVLLIKFMMVLGSLNRYASLVLSISGHCCVIFLRSFFVRVVGLTVNSRINKPMSLLMIKFTPIKIQMYT